MKRELKKCKQSKTLLYRKTDIEDDHRLNEAQIELQQKEEIDKELKQRVAKVEQENKDLRHETGVLESQKSASNIDIKFRVKIYYSCNS